MLPRRKEDKDGDQLPCCGRRTAVLSEEAFHVLFLMVEEHEGLIDHEGYKNVENKGRIWKDICKRLLERFPNLNALRPDALDWRPIRFTERVVGRRACALCGLLCTRAVGLPCAHTLCARCYAQCADEHSTCPLDDEAFSEDDVEELDLSLEYLSKRKVACWNVLHGCDFVGPAANLLNHYKDCEFHAVSCPRCRTSVLRSNIVVHCRTSCSATPRNQPPPPSEPATGQHDGIERARLEVKEALAKISDDLMAMQTSLNQCCQDVRAEGVRFKLQLETQASGFTAKCNTLTELCNSSFAEEREMLQQVIATMRDTVADSRVEITQHVSMEVAELSDKVLASTGLVSQNALGFCGPKTLHWYVEDWAGIMREARTKGTESLVSGGFVQNDTLHLFVQVEP
ncbi:hypothetical protein HPB47_018069 [Ixodes persulcatus]|uniref:Uncharacterized protein n=1 Tax=Ixodes persulcatus TaxID=34615 RepID=A0AC60QLP9_IXOPE|nr:hypothetical protein HPB47_018069 [Ixodes persulcatus]